MAFWSEKSLEPKRQFRFKVNFGLLKAASVSTDTYLAQYADRPSYTIKGDTAVHFLDKQYMFPGKVTWNQVKIRFVDAFDADNINVAAKSYEYLQAAGWLSPETQMNLSTPGNFATIGKTKSTNAAKDVSVEVLTSNGIVVDKWTLRNAFVTNVALNNLDYAQDGILTAEYTFVYDWADYNSGAK